ncbi:hypothetical protein SEA_FEFFERHEAD_52 [Mycobacterium phage Fefferhead]|nr:hypothetical protein SEA_FEFFERHEAD_52 [Mycobacterium phage Fefferhead]
MSDQPMCQACRTFPAHVFDPDGTMRCGGCAHLDLPAASSATEAGDPEAWVPDYAAINRQWREQAGEPNDADTLDAADTAYVWQDSLGAHWGWLNGSGWVAWNSGLYIYGRGAVGPFTVAYKRPAGEFSPMLLDLGNEVTIGADIPHGQHGPSNEAGEPSTSNDAESSNGVPQWIQRMQDDDQAVDMVNQPSHYNQGPPCKGCGRPIECLDITEHMNFCLGNTVKYVWRCDLKHDAIEDLRKARVYLDREIARREAQLVAEFKNRNTTKG